MFESNICCFVETKTDDLDFISIPGYKFVMKNRENNRRVKSGGIVMGYLEELENCIDIIQTDSRFVLWCKLSNIICKNEDVVLGIVYVPPEYTSYSSADAISEIESEYFKISDNYSKVLLIGDFNARTAEDKDNLALTNTENISFDLNEFMYENHNHYFELSEAKLYRKSKDKVKNRFGNQLLEFCRMNHFYIINGRSKGDAEGNLTCRNASVVDYCICSSSLLPALKDFVVKDFSALLSDVHCPIIATFKSLLANDPRIEYFSVESKTSNSEKINKWNKNLEREFIENIETNEINIILNQINDINPDNITQNTIDNIVNNIGGIYINSAKKTFGTKVVSNSNNRNRDHGKKKLYKSWFNQDCKEKQKLFRKLNRLKNRSTYHKDLAKRAEKEYKKELNKAQSRYQQELKEKMQNLKNNDPKEYWKILKEGSYKEQPDIDFTKLVNFFESLNTELEGENREINIEINENATNFEQIGILNSPITTDEILKCVKNLKNDKACSDDKIVNEYIKSSIHKFVILFEKIFNLIFISGKIPESWLMGIIKPFYKNKGDKMDPKNYRPITIVSCLGKLFTSILNERLRIFSDENQLLKENQFGFRKGYSTIDCIFILHSFFEILSVKKKKMYCAFVDFEKAFDTVWRKALWYKMILSNVNGYMYNIIYNMYQNIKSCVAYNGQISDYFPCEMGVRQGENLSPFLFSIFLNDLEDFLNRENLIGLTCISAEIENRLNILLKLFVLLYADDTVILAETAQDLQKGLDLFSKYCKEWMLKVNTQKTKVVIFSKGRQPQNLHFTYGDTEIEIVKEFNYLGVLFSRTGHFATEIKHNSQKATNAMYEVLRKGRQLNMSIQCHVDLFNKIVKPILLYGCEVWGFSNTDALEKVQLKFYKLLLGLKSTTNSSMIYGELGIYPVNLDIKLRMVSYWARILHGKDNKLSSILYKLMMKIRNDNNEISKWMRFIHDILNECGITFIWTQQNFLSEQWLNLTVKTMLQDQYKQTWCSNVFHSPKTINYRIYKTEHCFEKYLHILNKKDLYILCKFRTMNHKLPVEAGRWQNIPREERFCILCNENMIGDEYHYIMQCKVFANERKEYIDRKFLTNCNTEKFKAVMNQTQKSKLGKLCTLIRIINKKVNSLY